MARITPKTNWIDNDIPTAVDVNRIENNSLQAFNELDAEAATRLAADNAEAATRLAADNAEAVTRANADTTLQNNINTVSTTLTNSKIKNAEFSNNGAIGNIAGITGIYDPNSRDFIYTLPTFGIWIASIPTSSDSYISSIFEGNFFRISSQTGAQSSGKFWRIG
jgi:hypothetical protein